MGISRKVKIVTIGLLATLILSPIWVFEALVWYGVSEEASSEQPRDSNAPALMRDALWVLEGEQLASGVESLWAGNFFHSTLKQRWPAGQRAAASVARRIVNLDPQRNVKNLERHVRMAAVTVWLSRHSTEADLKQELTESTFFGRRAWGAAQAAQSFFGKGANQLTAAEISLLAGLPLSPRSFDPTCFPESAEKRRLYILRRLREAGAISASQADAAERERPVVLPGSTPCRRVGPPSPLTEDEDGP